MLAAILGIYWAGESIGGRIAAKGYAARLHRANAPPIAPVVRHSAFGGQEFAARDSSSSSRRRELPLAVALAAADMPPPAKRQQR